MEAPFFFSAEPGLRCGAPDTVELLDSLRQDRVAAVTSELSQLKLNNSLTQALVEHNENDNDAEHDPNLEITTFREISGTINSAFRQALKEKFADGEFLERLSDQNSGSRPEFCHVLWNGESADWKVYDPRDGTEVTFGALLEDVCRYWGVQHEEMAFLDANGASWPLDPLVWDELSPTGDVSLTLARRPNTEQLNELTYDYDEDESALPIAVQRRLERERRAAQLERHTKESIRKQKERERASVRSEMFKYLAMMALYFYVTLEVSAAASPVRTVLLLEARAAHVVPRSTCLAPSIAGPARGCLREPSYPEQACAAEHAPVHLAASGRAPSLFALRGAARGLHRGELWRLQREGGAPPRATRTPHALCVDVAVGTTRVRRDTLAQRRCLACLPAHALPLPYAVVPGHPHV